MGARTQAAAPAAAAAWFYACATPRPRPPAPTTAAPTPTTGCPCPHCPHLRQLAVLLGPLRQAQLQARVDGRRIFQFCLLYPRAVQVGAAHPLDVVFAPRAAAARRQDFVDAAPQARPAGALRARPALRGGRALALLGRQAGGVVLVGAGAAAQRAVQALRAATCLAELILCASRAAGGSRQVGGQRQQAAAPAALAAAEAAEPNRALSTGPVSSPTPSCRSPQHWSSRCRWHWPLPRPPRRPTPRRPWATCYCIWTCCPASGSLARPS